MAFDFIGLILFALATLLTPGPNNYLLFAHGKNYGIKQATGLMAGIFCGFLILLFTSGYGIAKIIIEHPTIGLILKIASSVWLIYLAFMLRKIDTKSNTSEIKKIGFPHALLMQFVNPKAWIVSISGASAFMPQLENIHMNVLFYSLTFAIIGIPCMITWLAFGGIISKLISSEKVNRTIGYVIFGLMLFCVALIWI